MSDYAKPGKETRFKKYSASGSLPSDCALVISIQRNTGSCALYFDGVGDAYIASVAATIENVIFPVPIPRFCKDSAGTLTELKVLVVTGECVVTYFPTHSDQHGL